MTTPLPCLSVLVALNWLRLYKSLVEAGLPQRPGNDGLTNLGFVRQGWHAISDLPAFDLRVGQRFSGSRASGLHQALRDAVATLVRMPIHYMTLPGSDQQVFEARQARARTAPRSVLVDREYLAQFGDLRIPAHLWNSLMRHDAWIEPALIAEWMKLMTDWATTQGKELDHRCVEAAMQWSDPDRDVGFARKISRQLLENDDLYCVWTGRQAGRKTAQHRSLHAMGGMAVRCPVESSPHRQAGQPAPETRPASVRRTLSTTPGTGSAHGGRTAT